VRVGDGDRVGGNIRNNYATARGQPCCGGKAEHKDKKYLLTQFERSSVIHVGELKKQHGWDFYPKKHGFFSANCSLVAYSIDKN